MQELDNDLLFTGIKSSETVCAEVDAGVFDWLKLTDEDGDGTLDSYLGTTETTISLDNFEILKEKLYEVILLESTEAFLKIYQFQQNYKALS